MSVVDWLLMLTPPVSTGRISYIQSTECVATAADQCRVPREFPWKHPVCLINIWNAEIDSKMDKVLQDTLAKIRVISGIKSTDTIDSLRAQTKGSKERFKSRIKSPVLAGNTTQVQVDINDQKIVKEL